MGSGQQTTTGTGTGGGSTSIDLAGVIALLKEILSTLQEFIKPGQSFVQIDYINTVGTTASLLYPGSKWVKNAIVQNLSSTDTITIIANAGQVGKVLPVTAGQAFVLNPATASGQAGGSVPFGNVDLGGLTAITNTNTGQAVSVKYEY